MRFSIVFIATAFFSLSQLGSAVSTTNHKGNTNTVDGYDAGFGTGVTHHPSPHQRSSGHHAPSERTGALQRQLEERDVEDLYFQRRAPPLPPPPPPPHYYYDLGPHGAVDAGFRGGYPPNRAPYPPPSAGYHDAMSAMKKNKGSEQHPRKHGFDSAEMAKAHAEEEIEPETPPFYPPKYKKTGARRHK
ncbi:hypothetical protein AX17_007170 [Amanita inopinata Kibby_2008]|nr:hypothetical protein AX17_007170 [Amanita inopinata Kibby_2008]